jgi:hypothetical protein
MSASLDDLSRVLAEVTGATGWRSARVAVSRETLQTPEALAAQLRRDPPVAGWVVAQSGHHLILDGALPPGHWLEGEWLAGSGASYQLRDVPGGWVIVRVVDGEGEPALAVERQHLADRGAPGALRWTVYHQVEGLQCAPVVAAFRGFAPASGG